MAVKNECMHHLYTVRISFLIQISQSCFNSKIEKVYKKLSPKKTATTICTFLDFTLQCELVDRSAFLKSEKKREVMYVA